MKNKNKTKVIMLGGIATFAVIIAVILCVTLLPNKAAPNYKEGSTDSERTTDISDISIESPEKANDSENSDSNVITDKIPDGAVVVTPKETVNDSHHAEFTGKKPETAAKPVTPKPSPEGSGNGNGAVINGGEQPKAYNCGVTGHHCEAAETHAYILNLELKGCEYCGAHNCPSFYATDEWGNACYTPSKCPKYDIKKDPAHYCQTCGNKCGDGRNGTCVQFVNSDNCPNCGKWVDGWKCHTCK